MRHFVTEGQATIYRQTSNISRSLAGNQIVYHPDVVGAVGPVEWDIYLMHHIYYIAFNKGLHWLMENQRTPSYVPFIDFVLEWQNMVNGGAYILILDCFQKYGKGNIFMIASFWSQDLYTSVRETYNVHRIKRKISITFLWYIKWIFFTIHCFSYIHIWNFATIAHILYMHELIYKLHSWLL